MLLVLPCCGDGELLLVLGDDELPLVLGDVAVLELPVLPCGEEFCEVLGEDSVLMLLLLGEDELLVLLGDEELAVLLLGEELLPIELPLMLPEELLVAPPPCTPRAASVGWSSWPEALIFCDCWNCFNAALVFGPSCPSTGPGLKPLSFSACWASRTSALPSCEDDDDSWDEPCCEAEDAWSDDDEDEDDGCDAPCWL